ncbi:ETS variant transcription factor anterior open [Arctopsyche grandis]|uniref:ETS variant transcription factor anterior open n=1 Tax=Arctopsyche grandis TaxID=121162 RepID=UPI00406D959A
MKLLPLQLPPIATMERMPLQLPFSPTELLWRYPLGLPSAPPSSMSSAPSLPPLSDLKAHLPASLTPDPRIWNREDVATFLKWCEREFDLPNFDMEMFQMNGKALCLLTKNDLGERCPGVGDVLHNVLQMLVRDASFMGRCLPSSPVTPTSRGPYPLSPHSHPPTPNWNLLAQPTAESTFHHAKQAASLAHFISNNSVTLSPAPSIDSQSSSPQHVENGTAANYVQALYGNGASGGSSGSNQSDSDEDMYHDSKSQILSVPHSAAQSTPPTTPSYATAPICLLPPPQPRSPKEPSTPSHTPLAGQNPLLTPIGSSAFKTMSREFFPNDMPEPNTNGRLLWDFLQQLLNDPTQRYTNYIAWKNHDSGVFKIVDPAGLAKLWGIQKNHLSMNYDKMSRALRYYYRVNILRKVQGERHCYQFLRNPTELKNIKNISLLRQQMSPTRVTQQNQTAPLSLTIKSEPKVEEEQTHYAWNQPVQDDDMPTDLSMPTEFQSRKRLHPDSPKMLSHAEKHRIISMQIGENLQKLSRERDQHFATLNLKQEESVHQ